MALSINEIGELSPEELSKFQKGRPSYDTNLLKEYTDIITAQKQYLKDKYRCFILKKLEFLEHNFYR